MQVEHVQRPIDNFVQVFISPPVAAIVHTNKLASSPGHSQILSRSRGEKSGEGLVPLLRHGPEMVDSVST